MKSPSLIAATILTLAIAGLAHADPTQGAEKIRKEYSGSESPDHFVFVPVVHSIRRWSETNPDIAVRQVQDRMQLESEGAAKAFFPAWWLPPTK
jgi:hypothetical protein